MPQTCPQCQNVATDAATTARAAAARSPEPPRPRKVVPLPVVPRPVLPPPARPHQLPPARPPCRRYKFDVARWSLADRISGVATIVLFISLFLPGSA